jgi:toxin ParE1/3/4
MKVFWTPEAEFDRDEIWDYIAKDSRSAAVRMDELFSEAVRRLTSYAHLGPAGRIAGTREVVVRQNYRVVYQTMEDTVWVLALVHAARRWPPERD